MRRSARIEEVDDEGELEEAAEDEEAIEDAGAHAEQPRAKRLRTVQYDSTVRHTRGAGLFKNCRYETTTYCE